MGLTSCEIVGGFNLDQPENLDRPTFVSKFQIVVFLVRCQMRDGKGDGARLDRSIMTTLSTVYWMWCSVLDRRAPLLVHTSGHSCSEWKPAS